MGSSQPTHEDVIKFVYLLDKWRIQPPKEEEISALNSGANLFPKQVKSAIKIAEEIKIPPRLPFLVRVIQPIQTMTLALTVFYILVFIMYAGRIAIYELAESVVTNPLIVLTVVILLAILGLVSYLHRKETREYRRSNIEKSDEIKALADDLMTLLTPMAVKGKFSPKKYPFKMYHNDYVGLRLVGKSGSTFVLAFSISHGLAAKAREVKIMTHMGRLSYFDGLTGFRGGKTAIKLVVSDIAATTRDFLKRAAGYRRQGVNIIVRKAKEGQIKNSYIILDDNVIWKTKMMLEELDTADSLDLAKIEGKEEKEKILNAFNTLWEIAYASQELEEISWKTFVRDLEKKKLEIIEEQKESKKEKERKKGKQKRTSTKKK